MLGDENGKIPAVMGKPIGGYDGGQIVSSDEFDSDKMNIDWQWYRRGSKYTCGR